MICGHHFKEHMELHCNRSTTPFNKNIDAVYKQAFIQSDDYPMETTSNTKNSRIIKESNPSDKQGSRTQKSGEDSFMPLNYHNRYLIRNSSNTTKALPVKSRGIVILARIFLFQIYRSEVGRLIQLENMDDEEYHRKSMYRHGK
jgi:hypothetical protein